MENYCKCKNCRYSDPTERKGHCWYCDWYGTYEDPDEVKECDHYTDRQFQWKLEYTHTRPNSKYLGSGVFTP